MEISLVCWHCGTFKNAEVPHEPQFAFEVASWANDVGMLGVIDSENGRSLVFCNDVCANAEKKKDGSFRLRPKGNAMLAARSADKGDGA